MANDLQLVLPPPFPIPAIIQWMNEGYSSFHTLFPGEEAQKYFFKTIRDQKLTHSIYRLDFTGIDGELPLRFLMMTANLTQFIYQGTLSAMDCDRIQDAAKRNKLNSLTHLYLSLKEENPVVLEMVSTIMERAQLVALTLQGVGIRRKNIKPLLNNCDQLQFLDLSQNPINLVGVATLLHSRHLRNLETLVLQSLPLTHKSVEDFVLFKPSQALRKLKNLDLSYTKFTPEQQIVFINMFYEFRSLSQLIITSNKLALGSLRELQKDKKLIVHYTMRHS